MKNAVWALRSSAAISRVATSIGAASIIRIAVANEAAADLLQAQTHNEHAGISNALHFLGSHLAASLAPSLVERGLKAGAIVRNAAALVGGGGGGRDTLAQAGGRNPEKLHEAIKAAESEIFSALED